MINMSKRRIVQDGSTLEEKILLKKEVSFISTNLGKWKRKNNLFFGQSLQGPRARSDSFLGKVQNLTVFPLSSQANSIIFATFLGNQQRIRYLCGIIFEKEIIIYENQ